MNSSANTGPVGFWSYVHADDDGDDGRILRLAGRVRNEYSVLTGDELRVFVDREDLVWGDEWRRRISDALTGTTFFIPLISPRYFRSEECRRELLKFAGQARSLGVTELLLPILYAEVPTLDEDSDDELVSLIASTQYVNWSELRLMDESSEPYRRAVNALARRLMEIAEMIEARPVVLPEPDDPDEEPGLVDLLADAEAALPRWLEAMEQLTPISQEMTEAMERAAERAQASDNRGSGFAGRIVALRQLAQDLDPPTTRLLRVGSDYASEVVTIDPGILTLIRAAEAETADDEDARTTYCELFESIEGAADGTRELVGAIQGTLIALRQMLDLSRDLRPPLRKVEDGLRRIVDAQAVIEEWVRVIRESDVDCTGVSETYAPE